MNNNDIFTADYVRSLPLPLQNDETTRAIAEVIAEQLRQTARLIERNIVYARIDELDEKVLDVLAYDLHVDWYDYSYSIEAKRAIIKDSVRVHKRMGTKFAVETALGNIHPLSYIEEWFEYGGDPFYFRVILDTARSRVPAGPALVRKTVSMYKRLSAHIDGIVYQCSIGLVINTGEQKYGYRSPMTGTLSAGTEPQRSTEARIIPTVLEIKTAAAGFPFISPAAGTKPERSTGGALKDGTILIGTEAEGFGNRVTVTGREITGTTPERSTGGAISAGAVQIDTAAAGFVYNVPEAGTVPGRSTQAAFGGGAVRVDTQSERFKHRAAVTGREMTGTTPERSTGGAYADGAVQVDTGAASFPYSTPEAGTVPKRSTQAAIRGGAVQVDTAAEKYRYKVPEAGTVPNISKSASFNDGAFFATATAEGFKYQVKRCGTSRCKS